MTKSRVTLFAILTVVMILIGCGGSSPVVGTTGTNSGTTSGTTGRQTVVSVTGKLDIPESGRAPNEFRILSSIDKATPDSNGNFELNIFEGAGQMVFITKGANELVAPALIRQKDATLNPAAVARAIAFFGTATYLYGGEEASILIDDIESLEGFSALTTKVDDLFKSGRPYSEWPSEYESELAAIQGGFSSRGLLVDPPNAQSGLVMNQQNPNTLVITNNYRRRAYVWVRQTRYRQENVWHDQDRPVHEFEMKGASGYAGVIGTIRNHANGNYSWTPVSAPPLELPLLPSSADRAEYEVATVGLGITRGDYAQLSAAQQAKWRTFAAYALFIDHVLPIYLNVFLPASQDFGDRYEDFLTVRSAIEGFVSVYVANEPGILEAIEAGDIQGAIETAVYGIVDSEPARAALANIVYEIISATTSEGQENDFLDVSRAFLRALRVVDLGGNILDAVISAGGALTSQHANIWTVTAGRPVVRITPEESAMTPSSPALRLEASVIDAEPGDSFVYHWSIPEGYGRLTDGTHVGTDFESSSATVSFFIVNEEGRGRIPVRAVATQVDGNQRTEVGPAEAYITVESASPIVGPMITSLRPSEEQEFSVQMNPPYTGQDQLYYVYTLEQGLGGLTGYGEYQTSNTVEFRAGSTYGNDKLIVNVFRRSSTGYHSMGQATAQIRIEQRRSIVFGTYETKQLINHELVGEGRHGTIATVVLPKVEGAKSYRMLATGGYDPDYWRAKIESRSPFRHDWHSIQPTNEEWVPLSGGWGPASGAAETFAWMEGRFGSGWKWMFEVTYE
ncbi:MAG: hypothetical protein KF812_04195 [Fimbriimonadaceae bacterium]|nr:hypothetical protein [Fimbriimonadaceae bacterium]